MPITSVDEVWLQRYKLCRIRQGRKRTLFPDSSLRFEDVSLLDLRKIIDDIIAHPYAAEVHTILRSGHYVASVQQDKDEEE